MVQVAQLAWELGVPIPSVLQMLKAEGQRDPTWRAPVDEATAQRLRRALGPGDRTLKSSAPAGGSVPGPGSDTALPEDGMGLLKRLAGGTQGDVLLPEKVGFAWDGQRQQAAYKRYRPEALAAVDAAQLAAMTRFPLGLPEPHWRCLLRTAAWPLRLVAPTGAAARRTGAVQGFLMLRAPAEFTVGLPLPSGKVTTTAAQFQLLLNPDHFLQAKGLHVSDGVRLALLIDLARNMQFLHSHGVAVGDLSPKNLLFSARTARTFFLDCDAMSLNGRSAMPQLETPDWRVRQLHEHEALATPASDSFKLALLTLRLLARDQSTFDPHDLPAWTRIHLADLLGWAIYGDAGQRPGPQAMAVALQVCHDELSEKTAAPVPGAAVGIPAARPAPDPTGAAPAVRPTVAAQRAGAAQAVPVPPAPPVPQGAPVHGAPRPRWSPRGALARSWNSLAQRRMLLLAPLLLPAALAASPVVLATYVAALAAGIGLVRAADWAADTVASPGHHWRAPWVGLALTVTLLALVLVGWPAYAVAGWTFVVAGTACWAMLDLARAPGAKWSSMLFAMTALIPVLVTVHVLGMFLGASGVTNSYRASVGAAVCSRVAESPPVWWALCSTGH